MRKNGHVNEIPNAAKGCPMCGADVVYSGTGRPRIYCSTRCRNRASAVRAAVRDGAPVVNVVTIEQPRRPRPSTATGDQYRQRDAAAVRRVRSRPSLLRKVLKGYLEDSQQGRHRHEAWRSSDIAIRQTAERLPYDDRYGVRRWKENGRALSSGASEAERLEELEAEIGAEELAAILAVIDQDLSDQP